jgi:hypothetical protein
LEISHHQLGGWCIFQNFGICENETGSASMSEINLPRDPDTLGFIIFGLREALKNSVEALATQHDTQPGRWLDELEARCLHSVKLATTEGATMDKEAEGMAASVQLLEFTFDEIRNTLSSGRSSAS